MNTVEEIWKDIPEYEGLYQASNLGRVKRLERKVPYDGFFHHLKEMVLSQYMHPHGYKCVNLHKNKGSRTFKVHQVIAMAFLGHKPCGHKLVVDHINNDKLDNRAENLQIITARENVSKDQKKRNRSSKYVGVSWVKSRQKWAASIRFNGGSKTLGRFTDEYDAHLAYQKALQEIINQNNKTNE